MGYEQLIFIFIILIPFFLMLTYIFFGIWVYKDCKSRGENPLLWILLLFCTSLFLGLIIYLVIGRENKDICKSCGNLVSSSAKYCETCGADLKNRNNKLLSKQSNNHKYVIAGISSLGMILVCLIFINIIGLISVNM